MNEYIVDKVLREIQEKISHLVIDLPSFSTRDITDFFATAALAIKEHREKRDE